MPRRLTLVIHSLEGGGAERVMAQMANHWSQAGDQVSLITLSDANSDAYQLEAGVQRVALNQMADSSGLVAAVSNNWRRIRELRKAILDSQPDCVIAFTQVINVLTQLAATSTGLPVILSERVDPRQHPVGRSWAGMRRMTYPSCRALVVQTESVADYFAAYVPRARIHVIPNGVEAPQSRTSSHGPRHKLRIAAMGRLCRQKGFDLCIEAFARLAADFPDWTLVIYGEGPDRNELQQLVERKGLTQRVSLPGWSDDPRSELRASDVFVSSSRYEGFPNALLEAMAEGLAVVSFDCQSGPAEIIRDAVNGRLVPPEDIEGLANAMAQLMGDETQRRYLGGEAASVTKRYGMGVFFRRWDKLIESLRSE